MRRRKGRRRGPLRQTRRRVATRAFYARARALSLVNAALSGGRFDDVERFCLFVGYPRSGHTLIGMLLTAHPEIVISEELDALDFVRRGFGRKSLFSLIERRDRAFFNSESATKRSGYEYAVAEQWQGKTSGVKVIGDKKGGLTTLRLARHPELLDELRRVVGVPLSLLFVVRNPYDNIATLARKSKQPPGKRIDDYFRRCEAIAGLGAQLEAGELVEIGYEDFAAHPREQLATLCAELGLNAPDDYLDACAATVTTGRRPSRELVEWTQDDLDRIASRSLEFPFLRRYDEGSDPKGASGMAGTNADTGSDPKALN